MKLFCTWLMEVILSHYANRTPHFVILEWHDGSKSCQSTTQPVAEIEAGILPKIAVISFSLVMISI